MGFDLMMSSRGYYSSPPIATYSEPSSDCCSTRSDGSASAELNINRAFIFSVPIFFTFILLFLFYIFCLRPRHVDWSSLRMRPLALPHNTTISTADMGLKKEVREMLPIIVYKESFSVKDTQCSICLLDYQSEDRLQQIPACGHTFHMSCIDLWLANHSTCPLCRLSLLTPAKPSTETSNIQILTAETLTRPRSNEETQATEFSESRSTRHLETTGLQNVSGEVAISAHCIDVAGENARNNQ